MVGRLAHEDPLITPQEQTTSSGHNALVGLTTFYSGVITGHLETIVALRKELEAKSRDLDDARNQIAALQATATPTGDR
jgi:hypothetical protein